MAQKKYEKVVEEEMKYVSTQEFEAMQVPEGDPDEFEEWLITQDIAWAWDGDDLLVFAQDDIYAESGDWVVINDDAEVSVHSDQLFQKNLKL